MRVLFVCTGNICRSPVADRTLQQESHQLGLQLILSSAGTRALNGKPMHPESTRVLNERSLDPVNFSSRLLNPALVNEAQMVLGLTRHHRAAARQMSPTRWRRMFATREVPDDDPSDTEPNRTTVRSNDPTDARLDIEDPIGRPGGVFDRIESDIEESMNGLILWIKHQLKIWASVEQVTK
ncbi:low molecular weight phosphotyrosine protein phosphatase [Williamsia limnetica]|nr:low molecular weight phosphotyrosine protein phosphatase [Williamsia limnetica]